MDQTIIIAGTREDPPLHNDHSSGSTFNHAIQETVGVETNDPILETATAITTLTTTRNKNLSNHSMIENQSWTICVTFSASNSSLPTSRGVVFVGFVIHMLCAALMSFFIVAYHHCIIHRTSLIDHDDLDEYDDEVDKIIEWLTKLACNELSCNELFFPSSKRSNQIVDMQRRNTTRIKPCLPRSLVTDEACITVVSPIPSITAIRSENTASDSYIKTAISMDDDVSETSSWNTINMKELINANFPDDLPKNGSLDNITICINGNQDIELIIECQTKSNIIDKESNKYVEQVQTRCSEGKLDDPSCDENCTSMLTEVKKPSFLPADNASLRNESFDNNFKEGTQDVDATMRNWSWIKHRNKTTFSDRNAGDEQQHIEIILEHSYSIDNKSFGQLLEMITIQIYTVDTNASVNDSSIHNKASLWLICLCWLPDSWYPSCGNHYIGTSRNQRQQLQRKNKKWYINNNYDSLVGNSLEDNNPSRYEMEMVIFLSDTY